MASCEPQGLAIGIPVVVCTVDGAVAAPLGDDGAPRDAGRDRPILPKSGDHACPFAGFAKLALHAAVDAAVVPLEGAKNLKPPRLWVVALALQTRLPETRAPPHLT